MKKILLFIILLIPIKVYGDVIPEINSDKVLIYDLTDNEVILDINSEEKTSIASLTKIMTVITALENIDNLEEEITITKNMLKGIYWNASKAGLKTGETVTYRDLLYASMLPSGADATNILAITLSDSVNSYVLKMNDLAKKIGMINTNFVNVTGLDTKNQYSTIKDVLILLKYALKNKTFKEIYTTQKYTLTSGLKVESTINKFNEKMNLDTKRILGSKTGFTDAAGYCLSSLINSNNHEVIILTLGAEKIEQYYYHIIDTLNLINYVDEEIKNELTNEENNKKEQILIINLSKDIKLNKEYKKLYLVLFILLICLITITMFCNKKHKNKK